MATRKRGKRMAREGKTGGRELPFGVVEKR
jgi:hypothetical protein